MISGVGPAGLGSSGRQPGLLQDHDVLERRHSLHESPGHRRVVVAAELAWHDQHAAVAGAQHELELVLAEDRHQRLADRADPQDAE